MQASQDKIEVQISKNWMTMMMNINGETYSLNLFQK